MLRKKTLLVGILALFVVVVMSQLGDASNGNPFNKILKKLDLIIRLLEEEVIPQLNCETVLGIPKTGQQTVYASCDDGDLQVGIPWPNPRFTDNLNGSVTDNMTGLIWLRNANCDSNKTWAEAISFSNNLADGICGLSDNSTPGTWRLPNRRELESLFDFGQEYPALPSGHPFENVQGGPGNRYWSSTTYIPRPDQAWYIEMYNGVVDATVKTYSTFSWPVRSGN